MKTSPTARSIKYLKGERGFRFVERVEQRLPIPGKFVTRDFGHFADLIAYGLNPEFGSCHCILAVQTTTRSNLNARHHKVLALDSLKAWIESDGQFELHGWSKKGPRGERKVWKVEVRGL